MAKTTSWQHCNSRIGVQRSIWIELYSVKTIACRALAELVTSGNQSIVVILFLRCETGYVYSYKVRFLSRNKAPKEKDER